MSTDPDWCRENPREAAAEIDRLQKRVEELEQLAAGWRDIANAKRPKSSIDAEDIYAMTKRRR